MNAKKKKKTDEQKIQEVLDRLDKKVKRPYGFNFYDMTYHATTLYPITPFENEKKKN